ncbi:MAG TPA: hypothetical protein VND70_04270 [Acidimicrobiales bacterium]|nr:hypothetical protein [Acidimicrobiales bacterium]
MTTTVEEAPRTPVSLGGTRGGPDRTTLRQDTWWVEPVTTVVILTAFVVYSTWAAFINKDYYAGADMHRNLISPFYSPCLAGSCVAGSHPFGVWFKFWQLSPALLILIFPLGFRLTCYYYRKAYYRSFWWSPPACAVADAHGSYSGETRIPLILQNVHRYFFWVLLAFNTILTIDAVLSFQQPGGSIGISVGTVVLCANAAFLWLYSLSCHACRHFCGGQVRSFAKHPVRHKLWQLVTPLNARHMQFAWISLFGVALADLYVRLVASGTIHDAGFHF